MADRPDVSNLAMVAVYPRPEEASQIAQEGGNDAETMHTTLVFLGEADSLDLDAVKQACASVAEQTDPLSGKISGLGLFAQGGDGYPQIAIPSAKGMSTLRTRVVDALANVGVESPSEHDWVPHMTVDYSDEPALSDLAAIGSPLNFDSLSVVVADQRTDYPFAEAYASQSQLATENIAPVKMSRSERRRYELLLQKARAL